MAPAALTESCQEREIDQCCCRQAHLWVKRGFKYKGGDTKTGTCTQKGKPCLLLPPSPATFGTSFRGGGWEQIPVRTRYPLPGKIAAIVVWQSTNLLPPPTGPRRQRDYSKSTSQRAHAQWETGCRKASLPFSLITPAPEGLTIGTVNIS